MVISIFVNVRILLPLPKNCDHLVAVLFLLPPLGVKINPRF